MTGNGKNNTKIIVKYIKIGYISTSNMVKLEALSEEGKIIKIIPFLLISDKASLYTNILFTLLKYIIINI